MKAPFRTSTVPASAPPRIPNRTQRIPTAPTKPLRRRILAVALGAVLAIYVVVNYISHQGLRASQNRAANANPVAASKAAAPDFRKNSERVAAAPAENAPAQAAERAVDLEPTQPEPQVESKPKSDPRVEQILRKQVKTFWESGNYSEAMRLVDQVLATSPANHEARVWKKRIAAAQEAEAAIK